MHGCDTGKVSDGSRLALYQTLSNECPSIFFLACALCYCYFLFDVFVLFFVLFSCSRWSVVNVPPIVSCPADHVPDWQPRILLGMSRMNGKKTHGCLKKKQNTPRPSEHPPVMRGKNVKTFRWDQRLQIQNLFMAFKQLPRCR